jgi:heterodisulfide reductase subunit A-like polyferredoxin
MPVDTVIAALGQVPETGFLKELEVSLSRRGTIEIDAQTGATNVEGVFAGGDTVSGPAYVIDAIAGGKRAARSIHQYLSGQPVQGEAAWKEPEKFSQAERDEHKKRFATRNRVKMREEPVKNRVQDFREVALGYSAEEGREEASRCLAGQIEGCIECRECERRCEPKAIVYTMKDRTIELKVGTIIVASGLGLYDISSLTEYGYGRIPNVITAMEFERLTAASGPTMGELRRASDGRIPENIAFIQCVGSRDLRNKAYCSSVCCMHATKEAMLAFEHHPGTKSTIFYMDMRAVGKRFQEYIARAKKDYNVTYIRGRPGRIEVNPDNGNPIIWYEETTTGEVKSFETELVVLAQAMVPQISPELATTLGIELDKEGFVRTPDKLLQPLDTTRPGVFACGYVHSPRDIPDSVTQASGAAGRAAEAMASLGPQGGKQSG